MKIVVTGSLGPISKPLTQKLGQQGHSVTVISSNPHRQKDIEALGATPAIGTIEDVAFLTATFTGADAAYVMVPTVNIFDLSLDVYEHYSHLAKKYAEAIQQSGLKRVVHLSGLGGHTNKGNGILAFHYYAEQILKALPSDVALTTLRPVGFYSNLLAFINTIKTQNAIITSYKATYKEPWASPLDIAEVVAEEIGKPFEGRKLRYIASDELTSDEITSVLGEAIGKPDLKWITLPAEEMQNIFIATGMNPQATKGFVEMNVAKHNEMLYEDYKQHRPTLGKVKINEFAKEFATVFHSN